MKTLSRNNVREDEMPHMPLHVAGEFVKRMMRLAVQAYSADDSPVAYTCYKHMPAVEVFPTITVGSIQTLIPD